jgi:hypothetical protein
MNYFKIYKNIQKMIFLKKIYRVIMSYETKNDNIVCKCLCGCQFKTHQSSVIKYDENRNEYRPLRIIRHFHTSVHMKGIIRYYKRILKELNIYLLKDITSIIHSYLKLPSIDDLKSEIDVSKCFEYIPFKSIQIGDFIKYGDDIDVCFQVVSTSTSSLTLKEIYYIYMNDNTGEDEVDELLRYNMGMVDKFNRIICYYLTFDIQYILDGNDDDDDKYIEEIKFDTNSLVYKLKDGITRWNIITDINLDIEKRKHFFYYMKYDRIREVENFQPI